MTIRPKLLHLVLGLFALLAIPLAAAASTPPALLPMPQKLTWNGAAIPLKNVSATFPPAEKNNLVRSQLMREFDDLTKSRNLTRTTNGGYPVEFSLGEVSAPYQADEAYTLQVTDKATHITANTITGLYHGLQTLKQLIVRDGNVTRIAPCAIDDYPAFKIRGSMQDVGRNFQSLQQLRAQIDVMAFYKMNIFHWHLSDHFGWRLESKIYPGLQNDSSFSRNIGKFYTQKEFQEFVRYCAERGITVIPEFDSPGHSLAFRKGLGIENMKDPKAKEAIVKLIDELCGLAPAEIMPYIHIGTDEVRDPADFVNADYLPALHAAVHRNGREIIGWWVGMHVKDDTRQILQTWAQSNPLPGLRHIDSRANYVNHLEALDAPLRMFFQQPCRVPHGDEINLGGILCYWPDIRIDDERAGLRISPVLLAMAAYSEAVWKGIAKDRPEYWAKVPPVGTPEFTAYADFEDRIAEHRDRFHSRRPFYFVKTTQLEWRLLGPLRDSDLPDLQKLGIKEEYQIDGRAYHWTEPVHGAAIHIKHFFGFQSHFGDVKGADTAYAFTRIHSDKDQQIAAWISFNTTSTSDNRAGAATSGNWNANPACDLWLNGKRIAPPEWKNPGKSGLDIPITDQIYTNRAPTRISLKKGWNTVLIKTAPKWKWCFTFAPIQWDGTSAREVTGLRYSTEFPD